MLPKEAATCVDIQQGIALGFGTLTCYWHITTLKLPDFISVSDPSWDWLLLDSSVTEGVSVVKMVEAVVIKHLATSYIVCHQLNMSFNSPLVHSQIGVTFNTFPMINCPVYRSPVIVGLNMWSTALIGSRTLSSSARDVGALQSYWCRNELIVESAGKDWWLELIIPLRSFWEEPWSRNWGGGTVFHLAATYCNWPH